MLKLMENAKMISLNVEFLFFLLKIRTIPNDK